jgi:hypothetical protein
MTTAQIEFLTSSIARFIAIGNPGETLALPFGTGMWRDETGRLFMHRNGHGCALYNETSDDIIAKLIRWSREQA